VVVIEEAAAAGHLKLLEFACSELVRLVPVPHEQLSELNMLPNDRLHIDFSGMRSSMWRSGHPIDEYVLVTNMYAEPFLPPGVTTLGKFICYFADGRKPVYQWAQRRGLVTKEDVAAIDKAWLADVEDHATARQVAAKAELDAQVALAEDVIEVAGLQKCLHFNLLERVLECRKEHPQTSYTILEDVVILAQWYHPHGSRERMAMKKYGLGCCTARCIECCNDKNHFCNYQTCTCGAPSCDVMIVRGEPLAKFESYGGVLTLKERRRLRENVGERACAAYDARLHKSLERSKSAKEYLLEFKADLERWWKHKRRFKQSDESDSDDSSDDAYDDEDFLSHGISPPCRLAKRRQCL